MKFLFLFLLLNVYVQSKIIIIPIERIEFATEASSQLPIVHETNIIDGLYNVSNRTCDLIYEEAKMKWTEDHDLFEDTHLWNNKESLLSFLEMYENKQDKMIYIQQSGKGKELTRWKSSSLGSGDWPRILIKFFFKDSIVDKIHVAKERKIFPLVENFHSIFHFVTFSKPKIQLQCENCHPLGWSQIDAYHVTNGGSILSIAVRVSQGKSKMKLLSEGIRQVGIGLGEMHAKSSSLLNFSQINHFISLQNHSQGIHVYWSGGKIASSIEILEYQLEYKIDAKRFIQDTENLRVNQPSFSLIHGNPITEHTIITRNMKGKKVGAVHLSSLSSMGNYFFYNVESTGDDIRYDSFPILGGAPELDYFIFTEDLRHQLSQLDFDNEEIGNFLHIFSTSYCATYHVQVHTMKNSFACNFPNKNFTKYAKHLAQFILSQKTPELFQKYFPSYII